MPTVLRVAGYRFFFYANESGEPRHVHVQRERMLAKIWLQPVVLASSTGFAAHELRKVIRLVAEHKEQFMEAWDEFFGV